MVMGRPNKGIDHIDNCDGSRLSKRRIKLILQTISGELSVQDACEKLGIQRARFAELRAKALQATVDAIEPGRPGRPQKRDAEQEQHEAELQAQIAALRRQLEVAETRALLSHVQRVKKGATQPTSRRGARG
jgi:hypothetical protein